MLLPLLLLPFFPHLLSASPELRAVLWLVSGLAASTLAGALICFSERIRHSAPADWAIRKLPFGRFLGIVYDTVHAYREHPSPIAAAVGISLLTHMAASSVAMLCNSSGLGMAKISALL